MQIVTREKDLGNGINLKTDKLSETESGIWFSIKNVFNSALGQEIHEREVLVKTDNEDDNKVITEVTTKSEVKSFYDGFFDGLISHLRTDFEKFEKIIHGFNAMHENLPKKLYDKSIHPEIEWDAEVRTSNELCDEEKKFLSERKEYIREAFAKYVGVTVEEIHVEDIPIIGFAGSGGGFRAMIANTAYMKATQDSGLYDCGVYFGGVSGCCLALASLYSSLYATKEDPVQAQLDGFKERLPLHIVNDFFDDLSNNPSPEAAIELSFSGLVIKKEIGLNIQPIDTFGCLLNAKLLIGKDPESQRRDYKDFKLSQQKRFLEGGKKLMPIYTAVHQVQREEEQDKVVPENVKDEHGLHFVWYEFTPFEIGCDELAEWVPSWAFGREFKCGKNHNRIPEQNIGQLIGMFGSAPCVPVSGIIEKVEQVLYTGWIKESLKAIYEEAVDIIGEEVRTELEGISLIDPAENYTFSSKLETEDEILRFIDAGVSCDLPLDPMVHPSRQVDVIIAFDSSGSSESLDFFEEVHSQFTKRKGITSKKLEGNDKYCVMYDYSYTPNGKRQDATTNGTPDSRQMKLCYLPFVPHEKVDKNFMPFKDRSTSFAKFDYTPEVVDKIIKLAKQNWLEAEERVKNVVIDAWKKKKDNRLSA
ncbi:10206_t:CDS:10 [Funneliformis mosseae]|uniref:Lysophospholipase n=1 Tax=Funneliformis mosseae TaxID=27381 RepID=A0A9N9G2K2_FUNMO|nr:10206_t:CDS:10 [Funneliformis mosseae]